MNVVESTLDLLRDLGINDLRLTGGEPTIHPEFDLVLSTAYDRGFRLGMVSNGVKLRRENAAQRILPKLSRCWISLYGATPSSHHQTCGRPERTFQESLSRVGEWTNQGYSIGISVLASPVDVDEIDGLLTASYAAGVRRLRILPIQPDGRGVHLAIDWATWPEEIREMAQVMRTHAMAAQFEILTINDPFDIAGKFSDGISSCLLASRKMLSITPDGWVYPCCFTVYSEEQRLGNVLDYEIVSNLRLRRALSQPPTYCHGLRPSFWPTVKAETVTCPISSIDPRSNEL